jgi:hypothetical protein
MLSSLGLPMSSPGRTCCEAVGTPLGIAIKNTVSYRKKGKTMINHDIPWDFGVPIMLFFSVLSVPSPRVQPEISEMRCCCFCVVVRQAWPLWILDTRHTIIQSFLYGIFGSVSTEICFRDSLCSWSYSTVSIESHCGNYFWSPQPYMCLVQTHSQETLTHTHAYAYMYMYIYLYIYIFNIYMYIYMYM